MRHARPKFLFQQHLDIFIPKLMVALEYQGTQHDRPVEFCGGAEAFQRTQERDSRKRRLCAANGVRAAQRKISRPPPISPPMSRCAWWRAYGVGDKTLRAG